MIVHDHNNVKQLIDKLDKLARFKLEIGIFQDGEGGDTYEDSDITILAIATIHEFGAPKVNIPERSFIRATFDRHEEEIAKQIEGVFLQYIDDQIDFGTFTAIIGEYLVGRVQKTIIDMDSPPLHPATIAAKKSSGVLVDTGRLVGAITWREVVD